MPARDSGNDAVWVDGPHEEIRVVVGFGDKVIDGGLDLDDGAEDAAPHATLGEFGNEPLDGIEPRRGSQCEVDGPARMACQPCVDLGMLIGGVVVRDGVDQLSDRNPSLEGVQEPDGFLMPMSVRVLAGDFAVQHIEGSEQGGGAMSLAIIVGGATAAELERQSRLNSIKGLDLALLVDREHDGMGRSNPTISLSFSTNAGSLDSLKMRVRCG